MIDDIITMKDTLLTRYEVRKTDAQKRIFAAYAEEYAKALGVPMRVEESGKWIKSRNLVFGDVDSAKTILTAHYDTCARMPFPNVMTPQSWPLIVLCQIPLCLLFLLLGMGSGYASGVLARTAGLHPLVTGLTGGLISLLLIMLVLGLLIFGPANPHTANDNTSGVAVVLLAMRRFSGRGDIAYVLFDNEEKGLLGAAAFAKAHPRVQKHTFLVQFDCVSDGGTMLYTGSNAGMNSKQGKRMAQALAECAHAQGFRVRTGEAPKTFYPSDQMLFAKGTAFAALRGRRVLYINRIHTPRDTVFDTRNIACLLSVLGQYAGEAE